MHTGYPQAPKLMTLSAVGSAFPYHGRNAKARAAPSLAVPATPVAPVPSAAAAAAAAGAFGNRRKRAGKQRVQSYTVDPTLSAQHHQRIRMERFVTEVRIAASISMCHDAEVFIIMKRPGCAEPGRAEFCMYASPQIREAARDPRLFEALAQTVLAPQVHGDGFRPDIAFSKERTPEQRDENVSYGYATQVGALRLKRMHDVDVKTDARADCDDDGGGACVGGTEDITPKRRRKDTTRTLDHFIVYDASQLSHNPRICADCEGSGVLPPTSLAHAASVHADIKCGSGDGAGAGAGAGAAAAADAADVADDDDAAADAADAAADDDDDDDDAAGIVARAKRRKERAAAPVHHSASASASASASTDRCLLAVCATRDTLRKWTARDPQPRAAALAGFASLFMLSGISATTP